MTLLVLDVRLPDTFDATPAGLMAALRGLWPKFFPTPSASTSLALRGLANTKLRSTAEFVSKRYVTWWLVYLFIATCLPFSTSVVGRVAHLEAGPTHGSAATQRLSNRYGP